MGREYPTSDLKSVLVNKDAVPIYDIDVRVLLKITGDIANRPWE
jgi:hypothetical protein